MKKIKYILCLISVMLILCINVSAEGTPDIDKVLNSTAHYVYETVRPPQVGSIGGEWAVMGLARSGYDVPEEYYRSYYNTVKEYVRTMNGNLHDRKYTEYSRLIIALTSIGKNPEDVGGYDLLVPLGDYEKTIWQGLNGPIWALIALDSGKYDIPQNPDAKVQATREMYVNKILECQLPDGGWSLHGEGDAVSDPDITGMALQALSKYRDNENVKKAIGKALDCMSLMQNENGGFSGWKAENSESCVQMITALCELGISVDDKRFTKNGKNLYDNLLTYYTDTGKFLHTHDNTGSDLMATEQALYGIASLKRASEGKNTLYTMSDAISFSDGEERTYGLPDRNPDVQKKDILFPGRTFADISTHPNQSMIEALASRGIINGKTENTFDPDSTMTRAEFSAIITGGLGLAQKGNAIFADVTEDDWFYSFVNTAYDYGIIKGVSENMFNPNGIITRGEAAVMLARAAVLCGIDTDTPNLRDILSQFIDYVKVPDWSGASLAFCYSSGILPDDAMEINHQEAVTRSEIAVMFYNLITLARLM